MKISLTSLFISNDPVITALPLNGNPVPDPPALSAYDAVNAKLEDILNNEPVC
jgi:hypothetical protein